MDSMMTLLMPFLFCFSGVGDRDPGLNIRALGNKTTGSLAVRSVSRLPLEFGICDFLFYVLLVSVERAAWFADVWQAWSRPLQFFLSRFFLSISFFLSFFLVLISLPVDVRRAWLYIITLIGLENRRSF
jgi:hypothetical protein